MKQFLLGALVILLALAAAAGYVWRYSPERLPAEWRRDNPHSRDFAPVVYRWKDAEGVVQLTDRPPADRPFVAVRIDPKTNVVPSTLPGDTGE